MNKYFYLYFYRPFHTKSHVEVCNFFLMQFDNISEKRTHTKYILAFKKFRKKKHFLSRQTLLFALTDLETKYTVGQEKDGTQTWHNPRTRQPPLKMGSKVFN